MSANITSIVRTALFLSACIFFLSGCSNNPAQQQPNAPEVDVAIVLERPVANKWEAVGRVDSKDIVQIQSRVEGFLIERDFVEGDIVPQDKTLFKIDPKPFEAELLLAKANVEKAKAALVEAKQNLARGQELYNGKNISKSELDAYTSTERQAGAQVDAAKAQVYSAAINLGYTTISAPIKGRIGRTIFSVGNLISPSSGTLATIYSIDPMYVYFTVDEKDVVTYRTKWGYGPPPNLIYNLRLPNGDMYNHQGTMDFEQPFIDKDTGTIDLRCVFPNPENLLLSGMYVAVIIQEGKESPMPLIPQASVQQTQAGYSVLVVDKDNVAVSREVELGQRLDAMWVVTGGIKAGERIIVKGLQKVQKNAKVTPKLVTVDSKTGAIVPKGQKTSPASSSGNSKDSQNLNHDHAMPSGDSKQKSPEASQSTGKKARQSSGNSMEDSADGKPVDPSAIEQQDNAPNKPRWTDTPPSESEKQTSPQSTDRQNLMQPETSDKPIESAPAPEPQFDVKDKNAPKIGSDEQPSPARN